MNESELSAKLRRSEAELAVCRTRLVDLEHKLRATEGARDTYKQNGESIEARLQSLREDLRQLFENHAQ